MKFKDLYGDCSDKILNEKKYNVSITNKITSLEGCYKQINGDFFCNDLNLESLKGCPEIVEGYFVCASNKLTSLEYAPKKINGYFGCTNNKISEIEKIPEGALSII